MRLCQFLIGKCRERGVKIHYPARAVSFTADSSGVLSNIAVENLDSGTTSTIACANIVFAAGAWTQESFKALFPTSQARIPVSSYAGHSIVVRSPRHTLDHEIKQYGGESHAVFTTHPKECGFSAEIFSRAGCEIYCAGLNSSRLQLPKVATDAHDMIDKESINRMKRAVVTLLGKPNGQTSDRNENIDDLEVVRKALCFRPWTSSGLPIVAHIDEALPQDVRVSGGVFIAAGHGPWGISLSLGTGRVVAELIEGIKTSADISGLTL